MNRVSHEVGMGQDADHTDMIAQISTLFVSSRYKFCCVMLSVLDCNPMTLLNMVDGLRQSIVRKQTCVVTADSQRS